VGTPSKTRKLYVVISRPAARGRNLPKAFHNTAASNFSSWNDFYASAITGLKERHEPSKQFSPAAP
jgi:hypothetical protein